MKTKNLKLAAVLTLAAASQAAWAGPVEYKIPSTQAEFETMWSTVPGEAGGSWEWAYDEATATPYASVVVAGTSGNGKVGETLVLNAPVNMKAGDVYYLQAKVSSDDYNNDVRFYIVCGTDINNLQPIADDNSAFYTYGARNGVIDWKIRPTESNDKRTFKVTEDGDYYIGVRSKHGTHATDKLCFATLYAEKSVNFPAAISGGKATSLQDVLGAELTWTWPKKNKDGDDIMGEVGANIYRATSDTKADLYKPENLVGTVTGGKPGEAGSFTDDPEHSLIPITESGKYYYYVATFNDSGENGEFASASRITCKWVGEETKFQPILNSSYDPAKATMIDDQSVEITFKPRKEPVNGGWYDESQLFLKVTRQSGNDEPVVVTETAPIESPYIDNTLTEPGLYTYTLYVVYKGNESSACKLATIYAGGTLPLPFSADFEDADDLNLFTILSDGYNKWTYQSKGYMQSYSYSRCTTALVTAPIKMEAGKTYRISGKSWISSSSNTLSIVTGAKADLKELKSIKDFTIDQQEAAKQIVEAFFAPETTGIYYVGFSTYQDLYYLYLDDVCVEESVVAPAAVSDLNMTPDGAGALKSAISFTIPSTTNAGVTLSELSSVTVYRHSGEDAVLVKEIKGAECVPGAKVEFDDVVTEAGMYSYSAVAQLDGEESDVAATDAAWVGYDIPKSVSSFTIRADLNAKGGADVKWTALSGTVLGKNGGYVDAANLIYRIYRVPRVYSDEPQLAGETKDATFTDAELTDVQWDRYAYGIAVVNGPQEGDLVTGNTVSGGVVNAKLFEPDLTNETFVDGLEGRSFTCDNGIAFKNRGETAGQEYTAYLPAFKLNDYTGKLLNVRLTLSRTDAAYEELLEVYLCTVEVDSPVLEGVGDSNPEAVIIPGSDNRELIATIPVRASFDSPAVETVQKQVSANGKYRVALRCASEDNKGLRIQAMTLFSGINTGIDIIDADDAEGEAVYYNLQGVRIENPAKGGLYIKRQGGKVTKVAL